MIFDDLLEALDVLLDLEISARDFYVVAGKKAQNGELKADLGKIHAQEIGHVALVTEMIRLVKEEIGK